VFAAFISFFLHVAWGTAHQHLNCQSNHPATSESLSLNDKMYQRKSTIKRSFAVKVYSLTSCKTCISQNQSSKNSILGFKSICRFQTSVASIIRQNFAKICDVIKYDCKNYNVVISNNLHDTWHISICARVRQIDKLPDRTSKCIHLADLNCTDLTHYVEFCLYKCFHYNATVLEPLLSYKITANLRYS